jgi:hypothetical protein
LLREKGKSTADIAEFLGINRAAVSLYVNRLRRKRIFIFILYFIYLPVQGVFRLTTDKRQFHRSDRQYLDHRPVF